jgi:hypothetical protein
MGTSALVRWSFFAAAVISKVQHLVLTKFQDWRWGTGATTPWYPSFTVHRDNVGNSLARVRERLASPSLAIQGS